MDNQSINEQVNAPGASPQDVQGLLAALGGQQPGMAAPAAPADPNHNAFLQGTGHMPATGDFIQQRGKIGPSTNPLLRLLAAATGRQSFDYTNEAAPANQADVSKQITDLFGISGPKTASVDSNGNPVVTGTDLGPQAALGQTIAQNRIAMMNMMGNFTDPSSAISILGPEKAVPLIQASIQRGFHGMISKEIMQASQTAGSQKLTADQQDLEKKKAVTSEVGKLGEANTKMKGLIDLVDKLEPLVKKNKPLPFVGKLGAQVVSASGGYGTPTMKTGADIENLAIPLSAAMNYELTKRFNGEEAGFIQKALTPSAQDKPEYGMKKLQLTRSMLQAMAEGNDEALSNVGAAILGKPVHLASSANAHALSVGDIKKGHKYLGGDPHNQNNWIKAPVNPQQVQNNE